MYGDLINITHMMVISTSYIVDDVTHHTRIHLVNQNNYSFTLLQEFIWIIKNQFLVVVKCVWADKAMDLVSSSFGQLHFQEHGILYQKYTSCTPQQNLLVERKHRHILEVSRALYVQSRAGNAFFGLCVKTAMYLINCTHSIILHNKTPFEMMYNTTPSWDFLKTFGYKCFDSSL